VCQRTAKKSLSCTLLETHSKQLFFPVRVAARRTANARGPPPIPTQPCTGRPAPLVPPVSPPTHPRRRSSYPTSQNHPRFIYKHQLPPPQPPNPTVPSSSAAPAPGLQARTPTRRRPARASLPPSRGSSLSSSRSAPSSPDAHGIWRPPPRRACGIRRPFLSRRTCQIWSLLPQCARGSCAPSSPRRHTRDPPPPLLAARAGIRCPLPFSTMAAGGRAAAADHTDDDKDEEDPDPVARAPVLLHWRRPRSAVAAEVPD
jgi:hypothetical protein